MSEPRPYPPTEWEEEQQQDASDAVQNADDAVAHADETMRELIETSKEIAANTQAVETLTREALIADNKKFRRRNAVLVFLLSIVMAGLSYMIYRDVFINEPQRDEIAAVASKLEECTTPGPHIPTADDPTTGHACFDDAQVRTAAAISQIIDSDQNGKKDTQEILEYLKRFEVFLPLAEDLPEVDSSTD